MIKNFPLRRMVKQLVQEGKINNKDGEIFKIFEDLPFNPTLEQRKDCLRKIKNGNLKTSRVQEEKIWEIRRKIMDCPNRVQILSKSIIFDLKIKKIHPKKKIILNQIYLMIIGESLRTPKK